MIVLTISTIVPLNYGYQPVPRHPHLCLLHVLSIALPPATRLPSSHLRARAQRCGRVVEQHRDECCWWRCWCCAASTACGPAEDNAEQHYCCVHDVALILPGGRHARLLRHRALVALMRLDLNS